MTGHVGDEAGKYVLTIPRDTTVMLKADYWNDHAPKTCSNATWLETCHTGQAHTSSPNACGCKHTINLVEGKTLELTLTSDLPDYDFIDTTVQQLKVQAFGGACQYRLGGMRLQVQAESCTLFSHNLLIGNGGIEVCSPCVLLRYLCILLFVLVSICFFCTDYSDFFPHTLFFLSFSFCRPRKIYQQCHTSSSLTLRPLRRKDLEFQKVMSHKN